MRANEWSIIVVPLQKFRSQDKDCGHAKYVYVQKASGQSKVRMDRTKGSRRIMDRLRYLCLVQAGHKEVWIAQYSSDGHALCGLRAHDNECMRELPVVEWTT